LAKASNKAESLKQTAEALKESEVLIYNKYEELYMSMQELAIIHLKIVQRLQYCEAI
jgi:hypothetical protein